MKFRIVGGVIVACLFMGCVSAKLSEEGRRVTLIKGDPAATCREIETISAKGGYNDVVGAQYALRNLAAEKGGNVVRLETVNAPVNTLMSTTASGTVFLCPR